MSRPAPLRRGLSLVEAIIALAILGTVLALTLEAGIGSRRFIDPDRARDDLTEAGHRALTVLVDDLANAAWFYNWNDLNGDGVVDPGEPVFKRLPWVNPPWRSPAGVVPEGEAADADGVALPVVTDPRRPRGDRLAFFRLLSDTAPRPTPGQQRALLIPFDDPAWAPVPMSRYMDGPPVAGLILNEAAAPGSSTNFVSQRWESDRVNTFAENRDESNLRCFLYVVERSPRTGMGRLVRRYRNAAPWSEPLEAGEFTEERELCDWVESVSFATSVTDPALNLNQVRVAMSLRRDQDDGSGLSIRRRFEVTVAMRSITQGD